MKIVKSLKNSYLLIKGITHTNENERNEKRGWFLNSLQGRLGASLLREILAFKTIISAANWAREAGREF